VDKIHIPSGCLDALSHHVMGMALERQWNLEDLKRVIKRSYCYFDLKNEDFMSVIHYLSGEYAGL